MSNFMCIDCSIKNKKYRIGTTMLYDKCPECGQLKALKDTKDMPKDKVPTVTSCFDEEELDVSAPRIVTINGEQHVVEPANEE